MKVELHRAHKSNDNGVTEANGLTKIVDGKKDLVDRNRKMQSYLRYMKYSQEAKIRWTQNKKDPFGLFRMKQRYKI